jgi:urea transport system substrate-binding protein
MRIKFVIGAGLLALSVVGAYIAGRFIYKKYVPIKIGILYSLSAPNERPIAEAALLAIEEINANGGLLGRKIEPIFIDDSSDAATCAQRAQELIVDKQVVALFGTYTSASRREVNRVAEEYNTIFFCPMQSEGVESLSHTVLTGATANQYILPAVLWCAEHIGTRFFIVGSQDIYSVVVGAIIDDLLHSTEVEAVGKEYISTTEDVSTVIAQIKKTQPDVIIHMMHGEKNKVFFEGLQAAGITSARVPVMSFTISEADIQELGATLLAGSYGSRSYFQSIISRENSAFIQAFKNRYGKERVLNDAMESAYISIYLWYQVASFVSSVEPKKVMAFVQNQSRVSPEGIISIDPFTYYSWKESRIGKINLDGQFDIVWSSGKALCPIPYPFKTRDEWELLVQKVYARWENAWFRE